MQGAGCTSPARSLEPSVPWMVPSESGDPTATGAPPAKQTAFYCEANASLTRKWPQAERMRQSVSSLPRDRAIWRFGTAPVEQAHYKYPRDPAGVARHSSLTTGVPSESGDPTATGAPPAGRERALY